MSVKRQVGEGKYKVTVDGKVTPEYRAWARVLERACCPKYKERNPTYSEVSVCEDWYNFQNFAEWWHQTPNSNLPGFQLDKDLKVLGNKIYGPDYCCFLPAEINTLINAYKNGRGKLPQGVHQVGQRYKAQLSVCGKQRSLGTFSTVQEARRVYQKEKAKHIRERAEHYIGVLPAEVFRNLMSYEV